MSCIFSAYKKFSHILKKTPKALKEKGFPITCDYKSDILTSYLDISRETEINSKLQRMYQDGSDLQKIKEAMNAEFFAAKFDCSIDRAHQILHSYSALRVQSILNTDQLLNVLSNRFGFSISKIWRCLNILSVHHETVEHFLSEIPEILGVNTVFLARRLPLILKQQCDSIYKIEAILKDFNITTDQLMCCPKVLSVAPNTLQQRLTALCSTEDFAALKMNKKFLYLVYCFKNVRSRLHYLKAAHLPCSINMFTVSKSAFQGYLVHDNTRARIKEIYVYIADIYKMNEREIVRRLRDFSRNRNSDQNGGIKDFSALNCRKVIEFLLMCGVTKEQIFKGLEIVFYEINTVKLYFKNLQNHDACQPFEEWISDKNLIQLLIYIIEVERYQSYEMNSEQEDEIKIDEEEDLFLQYSSF